MNKTFTWCVDFLEALAARLHMPYEEINIWIFVIIEPIVFFIILWIINKQQIKINRLKKIKHDGIS